MRSRHIFASAAAMLAALAIAQSGAASSRHAALVVTHLGTYHCVQDQHGFDYHLKAGERFLFHVTHNWAGVNLETARRVGLAEWSERWGWSQPNDWIVGTYHVYTPTAPTAGVYGVHLSTQTPSPGRFRHAAGTCTVQIFVVLD